MPELDFSNYLTCTSDQFTQVRDTQGRLLGAIPRVDDERAQYVSTEAGENFALMISAQVCVMCDPATQDPRRLPGFIALDIKNADIGDAVGGNVEDGRTPGEDPDIGQPI